MEPASAVAPALGPATRTTFGRVHVDRSDVSVAVAEGEAARFAARTVLGLADVQFTIVETDYSASRWGERGADGHPLYVWTFRRDPGNRWQPPPAFLLRHEIGHDLFIRFLVPSSGGSQYGGDAPDWLDEMAAIAFEGEPLRAARRRQTVRYAREGSLIPLARFLTMTHPELAAGTIPDSSGGQTAAYQAGSSETPIFYAVASAFYDFLVARSGNSAIVAELAAAVRNGDPLEPLLLARTGHADHADGAASLQRDFLAWIASDARYGGSRG